MNVTFISRPSLLLAALVGTMALPTYADTETPSNWSANVAATSNYIARGFTQSWGRPALQAGLDYNHAEGWYGGVWTSTLSERQFHKGPLEIDFYGGKNGQFTSGLGYTAGFVYYYYPGSESPAVNGRRYDYGELRLGLSHGAARIDYYRVLTRDWFGTVDDGRGSSYWDLAYSPDLGGGWQLQLHAGAGQVANHSEANWRDASVGLSKSLASGWTLGASVARGWDKGNYYTVTSFRDGSRHRALGRTSLAFTLTKAL